MLSSISRDALEIKFGIRDDREFSIRFYLSAADLFLVEKALREDKGFRHTDGEDEIWSTFETVEGGRWVGAAISYEGSLLDEFARGPYLEFNGEVHGEGDDYFDHTKPATELGLSERLIVASIARRLFVAAERFPWANANRVADDHRLEVESLSAEAYATVHKKAERRAYP